MKLIKLSLKNINSFRDVVEIDFESSPLNDASLLAITGATGSGKTTLLDALCVALYGKTPRLSSTGSQNPVEFIEPRHEQEGFAEVVFEANGARYHAPSGTSNGAERATSVPEAKLINARYGRTDYRSDVLTRRGTGDKRSERQRSGCVNSGDGNLKAFTRSVMLAQGDFAAFLKANAEERRQNPRSRDGNCYL